MEHFVFSQNTTTLLIFTVSHICFRDQEEVKTALITIKILEKNVIR